MFRGVNLLRLIPDRPGRGGTKFGYHAFQQEPINDTRQTLNVHVWQDSWRTDEKSSTTTLAEYLFPDTNPRGATSLACRALHGYCKYSSTDPSLGPMTEFLGHHTVNPQNADATAYIWDYTSYVDWSVTPPPYVVLSWDQNILCEADPKQPAVFVNVGNRCFIGTGIGECQIYDSSRGSDVFGNGSGQPHVYDLGIGAPTAAPVVQPAASASQTAGWVHETSIYISDPDPNSGLSTATDTGGADGLTMTADGVVWDDFVTPGTSFDFAAGSGTSTFSTTGCTVSIANGTDRAYITGITIAANEWTMLTLNVNGLSFIMKAFGDSTPVETPPLIATECLLDHAYEARYTWDRTTLPYTKDWNAEDDISYQPFTVTGYRWTMQRGGSNLPWPGGASGEHNIRGQLLNTGGRLTWADTPPSYAYAWYDPVTGHVSNISPVFQPEATSQTDVGVAIPVGPGDISFPADTTHIPTPKFGLNPFPRWTHILFFRTLMNGGSTLYPIGSLQPSWPDPNNPGSVIWNPEWRGLPDPLADTPSYTLPLPAGSVWYDSARDTTLLISGALRAPQFTNGKPTYTNEGESVVIYPSHMAYWDGRLWMAGTQDPAAIHYSCDRVQCPFGVPEESFPDTNVLRIPAADGAVRGMKLIGENLLITTERWAYTVAGNNEANYRLVRISTRMAGVGDYQMDEFVSDVEGQTTIVVFFGRDAKVYAMPLGGQAVCISKEIQTYLSQLDVSQRTVHGSVRVHCMSAQGRRMVLLYIPGLYPDVWGKTFIYDFDQKVWTEHTLSSDVNDINHGGGTAWTTTPTTGYGDVEIYGIPNRDESGITAPTVGIKLRRWFQPFIGPMAAGYVRTFPLTFDGEKTRKRLHFIRLYVNDESPTTVVGGQTYYGWRVTVLKDSTTSYTASPTQEYDTAYRQMPVGAVPVDASTDAELIVTDAALSPDTPLMGYTFDIKVTTPEHTDKLFRLYKIEVGWSTASEQQVDP